MLSTFSISRYIPKRLTVQSLHCIHTKMDKDSPPEKKLKKLEKSETDSDEKTFLRSIEKDRESVGAASILEFDFRKKRVQILSEVKDVNENSKGVVYWMSRDCRVQDNWAMLFAQKLALKNHVPLYVCFCLVPKFLDATIRHYKFLLKGLEEVEQELKDLNISFQLLYGHGGTEIPKFVEKYNLGAVVCDFSPLKVPLNWVEECKKNLPKDIPFCQVDAHNIVPIWVASNKQEYAARTIRNKINNNLGEYLQKFPALLKHPLKTTETISSVNWEEAYNKLEVDMTVDEVDWAKPGYKAGIKVLEEFLQKRLNSFNDKRNDPNIKALSNLSPWFHFGQIAVQRAILEVKKYPKRNSESVASFCEEAIVRRELADNFCYYNKNYDSMDGLYDWAKKTLNDHRKDKREYLYTKKEFEEAKTHDDLWNAAQIQLVKEGKIHGFLRMYWAKKILEWTESPEQALEYGIYLNDRFSLDGRDPNGYVGVMWSIGGIHDQGWKERSVFGKIRYMNYAGCKRKFDVQAFVTRYGAKVFHKKK